MNRTPLVTGVVGALLLAVLLTAPSAQAQTVSAAACRARVEGLQAELNTANQINAKQEALIGVLREDLKQAEAEAQALQAKIDALNAQITELRVTQAGLQEKNRTLFESNTQILQQVAASRQEQVNLQAKVIEALVKNSKRTSVEKLVEALPSIAAIIALGITGK